MSLVWGFGGLRLSYIDFDRPPHFSLCTLDLAKPRIISQRANARELHGLRTQHPATPRVHCDEWINVFSAFPVPRSGLQSGLGSLPVMDCMKTVRPGRWLAGIAKHCLPIVISPTCPSRRHRNVVHFLLVKSAPRAGQTRYEG